MMYDDGGISGATLERPALQRLLADIAAGRIDTVVVYKVDRLTRSLSDFAKIVEVFDRHLSGRHPLVLTAKRLSLDCALPNAWSDQRILLGTT